MAKAAKPGRPAMQVSRHCGAVGLPVTLFLRADGALAWMYRGEISCELPNANIEKLEGSP